MATFRIAPTPSAYDLATRLPAATHLADRLNRITRLFENGSRTRRKTAITAKRDAAERHLSNLERRVLDTAPRDVSDVVAQCTLLTNEIDALFDLAVDGHTASARENVRHRMHRMVHALADLSGTDIRDIGGDLYLLPAYSPATIAARSGGTA